MPSADGSSLARTQAFSLTERDTDLTCRDREAGKIQVPEGSRPDIRLKRDQEGRRAR
jgi:hypothetical protein